MVGVTCLLWNKILIHPKLILHVVNNLVMYYKYKDKWVVCTRIILFLGYPRLLSGDLVNPLSLAKEKQKQLFSQPQKDSPWSNLNQYKRYYLSFPFYPFRTLCPRDLFSFPGNHNEFDSSSPIFPANTQINLVFKRRKIDDLLNYLLPCNLNIDKGSTVNTLTSAERTHALTFKVAGLTGSTSYEIIKAEIVIKAMHLQVR